MEREANRCFPFLPPGGWFLNIFSLKGLSNKSLKTVAVVLTSLCWLALCVHSLSPSLLLPGSYSHINDLPSASVFSETYVKIKILFKNLTLENIDRQCTAKL